MRKPGVLRNYCIWLNDIFSWKTEFKQKIKKKILLKAIQHRDENCFLLGQESEGKHEKTIYI